MKPEKVSEQDGPFRYVYLAIFEVPGLRLADHDTEPVFVHSYPNLNAKAFLTSNWDSYCVHMDYSDAIAVFMLTGFGGSDPSMASESDFNTKLQYEMQKAQGRRHKEHRSPGCHFIYQAEGDVVEPVDLRAVRRSGQIGWGLDAIDGSVYRDLHKPALHSATTGLSLALVDSSGSPAVNFIADSIYLKGAQGLTIYCRTIQVGSATAFTTCDGGSAIAQTTSSYVPALLSESSIETAVSLFVQSQRKENDNLRAFIAAWSALELLVNRLFKLRSAEWTNLLTKKALPIWDKCLKGVSFEEYRLRDRFFAVACIFDIDGAKLDSAEFVDANTKRSSFYHVGGVLETGLPTHTVQNLFRKYLRRAIESPSYNQ